MNGLVLGGGGTRGAYEVGGLLALKRLRIKISGVSGTSIGSFNAAAFVSGKLLRLYWFWVREDLSKVLNINIKKEENPLTIIKEIISNKGIDTSALKEKLNTFISEEKVLKSKKDFVLVTFRLNDFKPLYIDKSSIKKGELHSYILASCYLPIFKMETLIDKKYYIDGGFTDNIPYNALIEKGYKKIFVYDLKGISVKRRPSVKDVELIFIKPTRKLGSILNTERVNIINNIKMGYFDTLKVLGKRDGFIYTFYKINDKKLNKFFKKKEIKNKHLLMAKYFAKDEKELLLKVVEKYLKKEDKEYNKVYNIFKEIKLLDEKYKLF